MDRETFDRLVLEHLRMAQRFAIRLTLHPDQAEEIVQSALLRAHRSWQSFQGRSTFRTWFLQIIVNAFRDDLQRKSIRQTDSLSDDLPNRATENPAVRAQASELAQIVANAVSTLPPRQREVILLHTYEQLSDSEIAAVLHVTPQNVRTTLHAARQRLREKLRPYLSEQNARR